MKKAVIGIALAAVLAAGTAFASPVHPNGFGIGALWGGSVDGGLNNNVALSLHVPGVPVFWGIRLGLGGENLRLGLQGDYYFLGSYLVGDFLGWFLGFGLYGNFSFGDNAAIGFGARLPIGLTIQPIDLLEIFLNVAPQIGLHMYTGGGGGIHFPSGGFFGFEIGLRLWF
ncbi:MAG: DUF3996 domain-containing protein [Treponema sp.]|nr:DUF3996 domain-containing protein [Treponema sp.]